MKNQPTLQNLADFENKSLLICDDDNPFRERLARAMEKKGFEVFQAESVQKGVEAVKSKKPGFPAPRGPRGARGPPGASPGGYGLIETHKSTPGPTRILKKHFFYLCSTFFSDKISKKSVRGRKCQLFLVKTKVVEIDK